MNLGREVLMKIIQQILAEESGEICCEDCCMVLDKFAEITLAGHIPALELPLVQEHLNHCEDCREQFEMLLEALQSLDEQSS